MNGKIEIPLNKGKITLLTLGSLLFVFCGVFIYIKAENFIGIICVIFFGMTGFFSLKKLFSSKKGIVIDENGISDYSNASSIGLIKWKDIIGIGTSQVSSQNFIMIYIINPEKYIGNVKNVFKKRFLKLNLRLYGTPFYITANTLKYDFNNLEEIMQSEFVKYKETRGNE